MDNCTICFENISVPVFRDGRTEISVENDCSRLTCGHAFHTKCLIQSLHLTRGCPLCRLVDEREYTLDPRTRAQQRLHMQSYCDEIMNQVKEDILIEHLKDYRAFIQELEEKRKIFNKSVSEFKEKLRNDMNIEPVIHHISSVKQEARRLFHREIKKRGGIFATAMKKYNTSHAEEKLLFGERSPWYFSMKNKRDFW